MLFGLIACAAALSAWTYKTTIPPVSRARKIVLIALRSISLALILLLLAEPLVRLTRTSTRRVVVALVADNSLSMTLTDRAGSREARLREIVTDRAWNDIAPDVVIEHYQIAPELEAIQPESLSLRGASTDIASALARIVNRQDDVPALVVLASDGNYNAGANPLSQAERSSIPIFTIGIGDSLEQKDVSVAKLTSNSIAYMESTVPVDAFIKLAGYDTHSGVPLKLSLYEDNRLLEERTLQATGASSSQGEALEYAVRFSYTPKSEGLKKLTVRVGALPEEATTKNNSRSFVVKVLKNKLRTVVVAGAPGPDAAAVMQTLESDKNSEPSIFYQTPDGRLRGERTTASFSQAASTADCLVLVGFPTAYSTQQNLSTVLTTVDSKQIPLFFISGRTIDLGKLRQLERLLPFTVSGARIDEQQVVASIPLQQQSNVLVSPDGAAHASTWEKLPPIYSTLGVYKAKPEATVLATMKMQGVPLSVPLIVSRNIGAQKSIAILGYGIGRWKLLAGASTETEAFFASWLSTATRWLAVREEDKRLRVEPEKDLFSQGEPVAFTGQAYSETLEPLDEADIRLEAVEQSTQQRFETLLHSIGDGRYESSLSGLPEGEYVYTATAKVNLQPIGTVHGRFSVGEQSLEFSETKLNTTLLRQISALSGGSYEDGSRYHALLERLKTHPALKPESKATVRELDMWNAPLLFFVIILCAGAEWFIRKRSGMV